MLMMRHRYECDRLGCTTSVESTDYDIPKGWSSHSLHLELRSDILYFCEHCTVIFRADLKDTE